MVERIAPPLRGVDEHPQILPRRLLPDELVERLRAEGSVEILGAALGRGQAVRVSHGISISPIGGKFEPHQGQ